VVKSKLVLVELREDGADVEMSIGLNLWLLKAGLDSESTLKEVESGSHLSNSSVIASHVVVCHSLS
jgi:hypothetical protein